MEDEFSKEIKMGFIFLKDVIDISVYVIKGFIFPLHCNYNNRCIFGFTNCTKMYETPYFRFSILRCCNISTDNDLRDQI